MSRVNEERDDSVAETLQELRNTLREFVVASQQERDDFKAAREKYPRGSTSAERAAEAVLNRRVLSIVAAVAVAFLGVVATRWGNLATAEQLNEIKVTLQTEMAAFRQSIEKVRQDVPLLSGRPEVDAINRNQDRQIDAIERRCCGESGKPSGFSIRPPLADLHELLSTAPQPCQCMRAERPPLSLTSYGGARP